MMPQAPIRVLLVEDHVFQRRVIEGLLANHEVGTFSLECCGTLTQSLERLAFGGIDVVLLDLTLPDSEGLRTFLQIHRAAPKVPIVVLTGNDDRVLAITAMQEGAEDFLVKGQVDNHSLVRALQFATERTRRRKAELELDAAHQEFRAARAIQQKLLPTVPQLASVDIARLGRVVTISTTSACPTTTSALCWPTSVDTVWGRRC